MFTQDIGKLNLTHDESNISCKTYTIDIPSSIASKIEELSTIYKQENIDQLIVDLLHLSLTDVEQATDKVNPPPGFHEDVLSIDDFSFGLVASPRYPGENS